MLYTFVLKKLEIRKKKMWMYLLMNANHIDRILHEGYFIRN